MKPLLRALLLLALLPLLAGCGKTEGPARRPVLHIRGTGAAGRHVIAPEQWEEIQRLWSLTEPAEAGAATRARELHEREGTPAYSILMPGGPENSLKWAWASGDFADRKWSKGDAAQNRADLQALLEQVVKGE